MTLTEPRVDPTTIDPNDPEAIERLGDVIANVGAKVAALQHKLLTCLRVFDDAGGWYGFRSCAQWLAYRLGCDARTARQKVQAARALGNVPRIDAAFANGELSYSKVRAISRVCQEPVSPAQEEHLLKMAQAVSGDQLEVLLRPILREQKAREREAQAMELQRQFFHYPLESGLVRFTADVLPEEAALVKKAVEAALEEAHKGREEAKESAEGARSGSAEPVSDGPTSFKRVDAFVALANGFLGNRADRAAQFPGRFEVLVHVTEDAKTGELEDGLPISPETARRLSCDASRVTLTHACEGEGGPSLDVSRRKRALSTALRRALTVRDRGSCRFPGCGTTVFVEAHHMIHWADGGETALPNLVTLCWQHHRFVHELGYRLQFEPSGQLRVLRADGHYFDEISELPRLSEEERQELEAQLIDGPGNAHSLKARDGSRTPDVRYAAQRWADAFWGAA